MVTPVVLSALLFWVCVFAVYFTSQGTTPGEFLFGKYEPLPDDLGTWKKTDGDQLPGLLREERLLLPEGQARAGHLLQQVRYRDAATRDIVRVEPERRIRRRRVRGH
jgi:hypothetical protein